MATRKSDIEKKSHYKIYKQISIKFRKDSGEPFAINAAAESKGITDVGYVHEAVIRCLKADGFDP